MKELQLKYGCNPNQKPSRIYMNDGSELPIKVLSGKPGYINFLDAFNGWQLVSNLKQATGLAAATFQTRISGRCSSRSSVKRDTGKNLLGRRYGLEKLLSDRLCLCESKRRGPYVFFRRFYFSVRCV